jgi:chromosome segregation ATPase
LAKKFKFDQIVTTASTVISGKDIPAATVITVNGDGAQILSPVASMLVNSSKAVEATEENVAKIKAQMASATKAAKEKAKPQTDAQLLKTAKQAIEQVADLNEQVAMLTEQVTQLIDGRTELESAFTEVSERLVDIAKELAEGQVDAAETTAGN